MDLETQITQPVPETYGFDISSDKLDIYNDRYIKVYISSLLKKIKDEIIMVNSQHKSKFMFLLPTTFSDLNFMKQDDAVTIIHSQIVSILISNKYDVKRLINKNGKVFLQISWPNQYNDTLKIMRQNLAKVSTVVS